MRTKNISLSDVKIAIIGLGYVGLPLAVHLGHLYPVVGFDINTKRVEQLREYIDTTGECSRDQLRGAQKLQFSSCDRSLDGADLYIVTVPTPVDAAKRPDLSLLVSACRLIGEKIKHGNIVVFESTVYPGATEEICVPILEEVSGLKFNEDFTCGYSPERINPGDKVNTLTKVKKIVGASTVDTLELLKDLYASIIEPGVFLVSSIKVAEAAKVIENCQRDLNIAFVNELSIILRKLEIDTLEVLEAAGSKWNFMPFKPGMVGGHCIGVDPYYLTHKAEMHGYNPQVILAGRRINDNMARYAAREIIMKMLQNNIDVARSRVGVMGVTFKENCPDIRNSKVFDLIKEFERWNVKTINFDDWADKNEVFDAYGVNLSKLEELKDLDCLVVAVGHGEYRDFSVEMLRSFFKPMSTPAILADLKGIFNKHDARRAGFDIFRL